MELDEVDMEVLDEELEVVLVAVLALVAIGVEAEEVTTEFVLLGDEDVVGRTEEVVTTIEVVDDLLDSTTYAPAPATTIITTRTIATTIGAIPLLD